MSIPKTERRRSRPNGERLRERESVLEAVRDLVDDTWGEAGNVLVVEGAAGVGKTAVLNGACRIAAERAVAVTRARCSQLEVASPFAIARSLLTQSLDLSAASTADERLVVSALNGEKIAEDQLTFIFHRFNALLAGLGPVVMVIDDAQWADAESTAWLQFLARRLDAANVRMIIGMSSRCSSAPLGAVDHFTLDPSARVFELQPLNETSTAEFISERLGDALGPEGAHVVHGLTGGNPFLLTSLIGAVSRREPTTSVAELADIAAPTVMRWVRHRMVSLPQGANSLVDAVAVLGVDVGLRAAAIVAEIAQDDAGAIADAVADIDVFRLGRPLNFCAPMVQASVYWEMSPARRSANHRRAAQMMVESGSMLAAANHLLETEPQNEQWIVTALARAAREVLHDGDGVGTALRYLERARVEMSPSQDSADFCLALAEIEARSGRSVALEHFRAARELPHDASDWVEVGLRLMDTFGGSDQHRTGLIEMLTEASTTQDLEPYLRLRVELVDAVIRASGSSVAALAELLPQVPFEYSRLPVVRAAELCRMVGACADQATDATIERLVEAVDTYLDPRDAAALEDWTITEVNIRALEALVLAGGHARAEPDLNNLRWHLQMLGRDGQWFDTSAVLADCLIAQGRLGAVEQLLGEMACLDLDDDPIRHDRLVLAAGELATLQGRPGVDPPVLRVSSFLTTVDVPACFRLARAMGRLHLRTLNWSAALEQFDDAARLADHLGIRNPAILSRSGTCEALTALGDRERAIAIAVEDLAMARQFRAPIPVAVALRTTASMVEPADRVPFLEEALNLLDNSSANLERCRTLLDLGVAHRHAGSSIEAKDHLRAAADLAIRMGALGLVETARTELRASGARPRRLMLSGCEALTPSEHRVGLLASQGHTNQAIADELFVSLKTVESHLARAYKKLGIKSRAELPRLLTSFANRRAASA